MIGRVYLSLARASVLRSRGNLSGWGQRFSYPVHRHQWHRKIEENIFSEPILSFEAYKRRYLESFEGFRQHPVIEMLYGDNVDMKKIRQAYESFCKARYNSYRRYEEGSTPGLMTFPPE